MAYIKQTWVDDDPDTPISASRLTHIENGIYEVSLGGGSGGGPSDGFGSFELHEDPTTGWPTRPTGYAGGTWIGWTDPTSLMAEKDRFIAIPDPS